MYIGAYDYSVERSTFIEWFLIDIPTTAAPVGIETTTSTYNGIFGFATIELSFRVVCATNYYGPDCSDFCHSATENCAACREGFTGEFCETNINDCIGVTCSENGVCIDDIDSFRCDCTPGFTGLQCETNINDCVGVTCSENGVCIDGVDSFRCDCTPGFTGLQCDDIDDCVGVDCSGNGHCEDDVDSFTCVCESGFSGDLCNHGTTESM